MKQTQFVKSNSVSWDEFEALCEQNNAESLPVNFPNLYRKVCNDLANSGVRVIVAGLDMDYKGNPFGPMPALMATAEYVTKVHAICTRTGHLANYSFRTSDEDRLLVLGERENYQPLSRAAFFQANQKKNKKT